MSYKVTILGKSYDLPPRTLSVDDKIEAVAETDKQYKAKEIDRRTAMSRLYDFTAELAPGCFPELEEVDTNDLMKAVSDIITAYDAPTREMQAKAEAAKMTAYLNQPEVQKIINLANAVKAGKK